MSIDRPNEHWEPNPQEALGLDPFTIQMDQMQVVNPRLDNGTPFRGYMTDPLQVIDPAPGLSGFNDRALMEQRARQIDPRMGQNRSR